LPCPDVLEVPRDTAAGFSATLTAGFSTGLTGTGALLTELEGLAAELAGGAGFSAKTGDGAEAVSMRARLGACLALSPLSRPQSNCNQFGI